MNITLTKEEAATLYRLETLALEFPEIVLELVDEVVVRISDRAAIQKLVFQDLLTGDHWMQTVHSHGYPPFPKLTIEVELVKVEKDFYTEVKEVWKPCLL